MPRYEVCISGTYEVTAKDEDEAEEKALEMMDGNRDLLSVEVSEVEGTDEEEDEDGDSDENFYDS